MQMDLEGERSRNNITSSRIAGMKVAEMALDNVETLDKENLIYLKELIENPKFLERYDHIFICGVNHESVENIFGNMIATYL